MLKVVKFAVIVLVSSAVVAGHSQFSKADNWGCTVTLCLANPAGYGAVAVCLAPVAQMFDSIRNGGGAPSCEGGTVNIQISRGKKQSQRTITFTDASGQQVVMQY